LAQVEVSPAGLRFVFSPLFCRPCGQSHQRPYRRL